ncbi:hypothetical protein BKA58DRAFT_373069 [Alternaria rosae]|uniref:uncharacterized protein n=1 Tax=Alternaria rosae TaxID=1187941 RepID=UPI001E8D9085|nr:uncharacterized protein BKA58DRAFT_373069 [Alternaria rosae]KAH6882276.1 hypothetical protein BKA58DRAFT_373069 [Alternaria rosae]
MGSLLRLSSTLSSTSLLIVCISLCDSTKFYRPHTTITHIRILVKMQPRTYIGDKRLEFLPCVGLACPGPFCFFSD